FGPDSTVLIGDTPADVTAAQDGAARIIGVASGDFSTDDLADAGAATVLADLTSIAALMAALYPGEPAQ
ncbi:MAG TPA: HAD hydrolase-like protein, partial [Dehalococcoidia bacterium]|nr:HAD hydrolase-like protein [Dehalococcoidia bacterium]